MSRHLYLQQRIRWVRRTQNYIFPRCWDMQVSCLMVLFIYLWLYDTAGWLLKYTLYSGMWCEVLHGLVKFLQSRLLKAGFRLKPYITDCWDTVARPVVIYIIVSQREARIFCLALRNYIHEAGSCSTSQIPHLVVVRSSYIIVFTKARRRMLSWIGFMSSHTVSYSN
jgi:hypothetical protein